MEVAEAEVTKEETGKLEEEAEGKDDGQLE